MGVESIVVKAQITTVPDEPYRLIVVDVTHADREERLLGAMYTVWMKKRTDKSRMTEQKEGRQGEDGPASPHGREI